MTRSLAVAAFTAVLLSTAAFAADMVPAPIAAAVADAGRPAADKARDANRKPGEVVAFAGVKPGMVIAELNPGGGYFTRVLAKAVGPNGKVFMLYTAAGAERPANKEAIAKITAEYPNVKLVTGEYAAMAIPEKADLVWTTENYHDFHNGPTANIAALNKAVFDALKPGGIYYVEDHNAADGAGLEATSKFHRMDVAVAKTELTTAGFKIDAEGTALKNPKDNRAAANSEGDSHFMTERFMLRAKKP